MMLINLQVSELERLIEVDKRAGRIPFCVVGTSGTVDVGAVDDLKAISAVAKRERLWFHIDGACGALGMMSANIAKKLQGIELADSIALDFHKWGQVPYDAGFILIRDSQVHYDTFASPAAYLRREERGMAAGSPWPCDFGPDLSRSFKALKVWFTMQVYGTQKLGRMMDRTCSPCEVLGRSNQRIDSVRIARAGHFEHCCISILRSRHRAFPTGSNQFRDRCCRSRVRHRRSFIDNCKGPLCDSRSDLQSSNFGT